MKTTLRARNKCYNYITNIVIYNDEYLNKI